MNVLRAALNIYNTLDKIEENKKKNTKGSHVIERRTEGVFEDLVNDSRTLSKPKQVTYLNQEC